MSGPSRPTGKKPSGGPGGPSRPTGKKPSGVPGDQGLVTITEEYKDLFKYRLENHVRNKKDLEEITNKIFGYPSTSGCKEILTGLKINLMYESDINIICEIVKEYIKYLESHPHNASSLQAIAAMGVSNRNFKSGEITASAAEIVRIMNAPSIVDSFLSKNPSVLEMSIEKYRLLGITLPDYIIKEIVLKFEYSKKINSNENTKNIDIISLILEFVHPRLKSIIHKRDNRSLIDYGLLQSVFEGNIELTRLFLRYGANADAYLYDILNTAIYATVPMFRLIINSGIDIYSEEARGILDLLELDEYEEYDAYTKLNILRERRERDARLNQTN